MSEINQLAAAGVARGVNCRFCSTPLRHTFVDLGMSPLCESYVSLEKLNGMEAFYPLHVQVCENCCLVDYCLYYRGNSL